MILKANNYSCMYRCELPKLQFLNFEVALLLDLSFSILKCCFDFDSSLIYSY